MKLARSRNFFPVGIFVIASVVALVLCTSVSSASPIMNDQIPGFAEARDLSVTNASLPNETIISKYPITPIPIKIGIMYEGTVAEVRQVADAPRNRTVWPLPAHTCRKFYVVLLGCDRQGWTRPALTRHGDGRRVPARAFPPEQVPVPPSGRLS